MKKFLLVIAVLVMSTTAFAVDQMFGYGVLDTAEWTLDSVKATKSTNKFGEPYVDFWAHRKSDGMIGDYWEEMGDAKARADSVSVSPWKDDRRTICWWFRGIPFLVNFDSLARVRDARADSLAKIPEILFKTLKRTGRMPVKIWAGAYTKYDRIFTGGIVLNVYFVPLDRRGKPVHCYGDADIQWLPRTLTGEGYDPMKDAGINPGGGGGKVTPEDFNETLEDSDVKVAIFSIPALWGEEYIRSSKVIVKFSPYGAGRQLTTTLYMK